MLHIYGLRLSIAGGLWEMLYATFFFWVWVHNATKFYFPSIFNENQIFFLGVASNKLNRNCYLMKFYSWNKYVVFYYDVRMAFARKSKFIPLKHIPLKRRIVGWLLALHLFVIYCCYYCNCIRVSYFLFGQWIMTPIVILKESYWILWQDYINFPLWSLFLRCAEL